jgi:hypothetical protein
MISRLATLGIFPRYAPYLHPPILGCTASHVVPFVISFLPSNPVAERGGLISR